MGLVCMPSWSIQAMRQWVLGALCRGTVGTAFSQSLPVKLPQTYIGLGISTSGSANLVFTALSLTMFDSVSLPSTPSMKARMRR